jgi:NAD(P)-dependent dehydrogenase (short-subunit alcohol dehydrogenase family)
MTTADPAPAPSLASFASPLRALVFGAAGGLGAALAAELAGHPRVARVYSAARVQSPESFS